MDRKETQIAKNFFILYRAFIVRWINIFYYTFERKVIPYNSVQMHTLMVWWTGTGKSEQMKTFAYSRVVKKNKKTLIKRAIAQLPFTTKNTRHSLVLLDPHGDIAQEVAQRKEHRNDKHFYYFNLTLKKWFSWCFNIFDQEIHDEMMLELTAQEITGAFKQLIKDAGLSVQMEALLTPCIATLLRDKNRSLRDLQRFMLAWANDDLIALWRKSPNLAHRNFFDFTFDSWAYATTRHSIYTKLQSLLNNSAFSNATTRPSTISLEKALDEWSTIVISLSKGEIGEEVSSALWKFIVASITAIALRRAKRKGYRRPIHLMIDECQNYIWNSIETILTEARKYWLYLTLANQYTSQIRDRFVRKGMLANTAIKCIWATSHDAAKDLWPEIGVSPSSIQSLKRGQFYVKSARQRKAFRLKWPKSLLKWKNTMRKKEREKVIARQIEEYYHNVADNPQGANLRLFMGKTSKQELANEQPVEMPRQDEFEEKNINQARRLDFEDYEQADRDEYHTNGTIATT